ncbi:MAG: hypothetical protein PVS3B3_23320 [Ktedonobacteraceae bacterium]
MHLLRDGPQLKEEYREDERVQEWFRALKAVYERVRNYAGPDLSLPKAK